MDAPPLEFEVDDRDNNPWAAEWEYPAGRDLVDQHNSLLPDNIMPDEANALAGTGKFARGAAEANIIEKLYILADIKDISKAVAITTFLLPDSPPTLPPLEDTEVNETEAFLAGMIMYHVLLFSKAHSNELWMFNFQRGNRSIRYDKQPLPFKRKLGLGNVPKHTINVARNDDGSLKLITAPGTCLGNLVTNGVANLCIDDFNHALVVQFNQQKKVEVWDPNLNWLQDAEARAHYNATKTEQPVGWCALWAAYHLDCILAKQPAASSTDTTGGGLPLTRLKHKLGARYVNAAKRGMGEERWRNVLANHITIKPNFTMTEDDYDVFTATMYPAIGHAIDDILLKREGAGGAQAAFVDQAL
jgi:hypothetical protein